MSDFDKLPITVQQALEPIQLQRETVTVNDLKNLKNEEVIVLFHPKINGIQLKIRKDWRVENMLGSPVAFYGDTFVIEDTADRVYPNHGVAYTEKQMSEYVYELFQAETPSMYQYLRYLAKKALKPGDIIEFQDGKRGMITIPEGQVFPCNPVFIPFKKDGTLSRHKPRYIYANETYTIIQNQTNEGENEK